MRAFFGFMSIKKRPRPTEDSELAVQLDSDGSKAAKACITSASPFDNLDDDILALLLSYLGNGIECLRSLPLVCKRFKSLMRHHLLWKRDIDLRSYMLPLESLPEEERSVRSLMFITALCSYPVCSVEVFSDNSPIFSLFPSQEMTDQFLRLRPSLTSFVFEAEYSGHPICLLAAQFSNLTCLRLKMSGSFPGHDGIDWKEYEVYKAYSTVLTSLKKLQILEVDDFSFSPSALESVLSLCPIQELKVGIISGPRPNNTTDDAFAMSLQMLDSIFTCTRLRKLELSVFDTLASRNVPAILDHFRPISNLVSLESVIFAEMDFSLFAFLTGALSQLTHLEVHEMFYDEGPVPALAILPHLISLTYNEQADEPLYEEVLMRWMASLPNLKWLHHPIISFYSPSIVAGQYFPSLVRLGDMNVKMDEANLMFLINLVSLRELTIRLASNIHEGALVSTLHQLTALTSLRFLWIDIAAVRDISFVDPISVNFAVMALKFFLPALKIKGCRPMEPHMKRMLGLYV